MVKKYAKVHPNWHFDPFIAAKRCYHVRCQCDGATLNRYIVQMKNLQFMQRAISINVMKAVCVSSVRCSPHKAKHMLEKWHRCQCALQLRSENLAQCNLRHAKQTTTKSDDKYTLERAKFRKKNPISHL